MKKIFILLIAILLLFTGCKSEDRFEKVDMEYYDYFDTVITITYYGDSRRKDEVKEAVEEKLKYYHNLLTDYEGEGVVATINREGRGDNKELVALTKQVLQDEKNVDYVVDLSKGKLFRLWKDAILNEELPDKERIVAAMKTGGPDSVEIVDEEIILKNSAQLDYGAFCKGYLNDELVKLMRDLKIDNYILNSGGNITVMGKPAANRDKFTIGIQSPFDTNDYVDTITTSNMSVVTSGDYQRYAVINGEYYHHIIDLKTGYPAHNHKRSITILGPSAYVCDFLSTSLFLKSEDEVEEILKAYPDYYYYTVYDDQTFTCSEELKPILGSFNK